jgi:hypothetical protein
MIVPQGNTIPEWRKCLHNLIDITKWTKSNTTIVGIPKILHRIAEQGGMEDFHRFELLGFIPEDFKVHMLGCWGGWGEMRNHPRVTSWDTSLPVAAAQRNVLLEVVASNKKYQLEENTPVDDTRIAEINAIFIAKRLESQDVHTCV